MAKMITGLIDQIVQRRAVQRWRRYAGAAKNVDLDTLRKIQGRAHNLKRPLDDLIHIADSRLMLPIVGADAIQSPRGSDWVWRPEVWRGPVVPVGMSSVASTTKMGAQVTVFHDCKISELTLRQLRNRRKQDLAPFGLQLDVFRFDGSYLSLAIDLPSASVKGIKKNHLLRMDTIIEMEKPLEIFARLNIKHGPNTEQLVRELPLHESEVMVEFDLSYTNLNEKRAERIWIDLIFEGPQMNQIIMRDITFSRRPRAAL